MPRNLLQHHFRVHQHFIVPETQYPKSLRMQPCVPSTIARAVQMLPTVNLDDEFRLQTDEIQHVRSARLLPLELRPAQLAVS
jgi:hypothetical protein